MIRAGACRLPRILVIIGSTQKNQAGQAVGSLLAVQLGRHDDLELAFLNLLDYRFPDRHPLDATPSMARFAAPGREARRVRRGHAGTQSQLSGAAETGHRLRATSHEICPR